MVRVGDRVKVLSNHWARPSQTGVIAKEMPGESLNQPDGRFLVYFDKDGIGLGGRYLYMEEREFNVLAEKA